MLKSMTGFSSTILTLPLPVAENGLVRQLHLSITLKTLNSRFFEVNCKLPYSLTFLETELIKYFKSKLFRGTIQFTIHMSDPTALTGVIEPGLATIGSYIAAIDRIKEHFSLDGDFTLHDLIKLPNVFQTREAPLDPKTVESIWQAIYSLTDICDQVRTKEGAALEKDLLNRISVIKKHLSQLEPRANEVMEQKKEQLFANLKSVLTESSQELAAESQTALIYNQLEKIDIHEEIVRFSAHIDSLSAIIASPEVEKGKKLDFTLQELFREINTITSKSSDAHISALAINIKVELEKAREQAQNIV